MGHLTWIPNLGTQPEHLGTCAATKLDYTGLARQKYTACTVLYLYFSIPFTLEPGNGLHEVWGGGSTRPVWEHLGTCAATKLDYTGLARQKYTDLHCTLFMLLDPIHSGTG